MSFDHRQKSYIKRNIWSSSIPEIAANLQVEKREIVEYLEKKWGKDKLNKFLSKKNTHNSFQPKGFKHFVKENWKYLILLLVIALSAYLNAFDNAFVSDDIADIQNNPIVGDLSYTLARPFGFIRPFLYWVVANIGGLNPAFFRSINVFFHLGSVLLVFALLSMLYNKRVALLTALIFAVHPILIEAVSWISGGMYSQYTFFFLISFIAYIKSKDSKKYYILSVLAFLLSFISHPVMPASLIAVFPLYELCFGDIKKNWKKTIPYVLITVFYVVFNLVNLPERTTTLQTVHYQEGGIDNPLIQIPVATTQYFKLIVLPKDLTLYHSELAFSTVEYIIRFIIFIAFLGSLVLSFKKNKSIFFWLSLFFISLTPTLTPFRLNWIVAERYVYLGSIGIFATVILLTQKFIQNKATRPIFYSIFVLILLLLSARTIMRNVDWHSEDNLWIATGKTSPSSPNTHNNLGDVYGRRGDKEAALKSFQTAITLKPNYADAYHNLANTHHELGQDDKALENYHKAIEFNPNLWQSYQNIAAIYFNHKEFDKSLEYIQKAIAINPSNVQLRINLGVIYLVSENKEQAKEVFSNILRVDPQNQVAHQGLIEASK